MALSALPEKARGALKVIDIMSILYNTIIVKELKQTGGNMRNRMLALMLSLVAAGSIIVAAETGEQLTLNKCGSCHGVNKLCRHLARRDAAAWTKTVDRMIKKGAKVNDQEKKTLAEYLAGLKAGAKPICK